MSAKISNPRASPAISPNSNVRRHVKERRCVLIEWVAVGNGGHEIDNREKVFKSRK
jgi:hypothetical protein